MRKKIFILCFLLIQSCTYNMKATYKYTLENVEGNEKINFKKTNTFNVTAVNDNDPNDDSPLRFEDEFIKIKWNPNVKLFNFRLENKTNSTIKIVWDSGLFIDYDGASYRIINKDKKLIEDEGPTVPTPIIKKGFIEDLVYPVGFAYYTKGFSFKGYYVSGRWETPPLLPRYLIDGNDETQAKRKKEINEKFIGKYFKILLPIEINNKIKEYIFHFKIEDAIFEKY